MGLIDKIKNALFEVEYVEVEEPVKKEKKSKEKKEEKPIAKKIVLPGKKEEKIEELHEEELKDEDFEIRPKDEKVKEVVHEEFKYMDDNDFKVDEEDPIPEEPEILQVLDNVEEPKINRRQYVEEYLEEVPEVKEEAKEEVKEEPYSSYSIPVQKESKPYGLDNSYNVSVHPYGTYEKKEEKNYFRPSPIISPIYGILDKNYRKEDVKEKREVRLSSSYSRSNVSVDDIRNKAYGEEKKEEVIPEPKEVEKEDSTKFEVEEEEDYNLLVDLSDRAKPAVKEITVGDAVEYFQDLGLEYNVDYVDVSKEKNAPKTVQEDNIVEEALIEEEKEPVAEVEKTVEEVSDKKAENTLDDDNDNLFDLIDSMYQENE